jgi:hypothetical protein
LRSTYESRILIDCFTAYERSNGEERTGNLEETLFLEHDNTLAHMGLFVQKFITKNTLQ